MFLCGQEKKRQLTCNAHQNFIHKKSKDQYSPHMAVGVVPPGEAKEVKKNVEKEPHNDWYSAQSVVVAHLANFCTVSSIFGSYPTLFELCFLIHFEFRYI